MEGRRTIVLEYLGRETSVSRTDAPAIADELWKGFRPGAVTAAAKLSEHLRQGDRRFGPVTFNDHEGPAIEAALEALGLGAGPHDGRSAI
jgi:hypothetical protein